MRLNKKNLKVFNKPIKLNNKNQIKKVFKNFTRLNLIGIIAIFDLLIIYKINFFEII